MSQSIGVGMVSSVAAGTTSRYVSSTLNNTFAPEKPKTNPVQEAFNPTAILTDVFFGGITGGVTHWATGGIYQTKASIQRQKEIAAQHKQNYCGGEAKKIQAADPVDDITPKVSDVVDDAINQTDDVLSTPNFNKSGAEGGTKANYLEQLNGFSENKVNHIINGSKGSNHRWEKLVPDKNWDDIKNIIGEVMETGVEGSYKSVYSKQAIINGFEVEVTYAKLSDGTIKISDAWIRQ